MIRSSLSHSPSHSDFHTHTVAHTEPTLWQENVRAGIYAQDFLLQASSIATRTQARSRVRREGEGKGGERQGQSGSVVVQVRRARRPSPFPVFGGAATAAPFAPWHNAYSNDWSRTTPHQHAHHTRTEPVVSGSCAFTSSRAFRDSARPGQGRRSSAHPPCTAYCGHCGGPAAVIARWRGVSKTT